MEQSQEDIKKLYAKAAKQGRETHEAPSGVNYTLQQITDRLDYAYLTAPYFEVMKSFGNVTGMTREQVTEMKKFRAEIIVKSVIEPKISLKTEDGKINYATIPAVDKEFLFETAMKLMGLDLNKMVEKTRKLALFRKGSLGKGSRTDVGKKRNSSNADNRKTR